jgi:hypothetical protein
MRAHLAELGIVAAQGDKGVKELLAIVADQQDARLPVDVRASVHHALYVECREKAEREASPTGIIDSQSVKSAKKGGQHCLMLRKLCNP